MAVAGLLDATLGEIVFTGSGSEANTLAVRGVALATRDRANKRGSHVITQATEHPAVLRRLDPTPRHPR